MTTRELIVYLQKKASQYTPAELLFLTDQVCKMILGKVSAQRYNMDTATGMPPFLSTTDGIYTYDCPSDCMRTIAVFSEDIKSYSRIKYDAVIKSYEYRGSSYYSLPIKSIDALPGQLAKITFVGFNPGTTTDKYYHQYAIKAPDITSQNVDIPIPEQHHFAIADGVLARIRSERFGDNSEWVFWQKRTMLDIVSELNQGAQPQMGATPTRPEYRHYFDPVRGNRIA
jgi:hypothetical protein